MFGGKMPLKPKKGEEEDLKNPGSIFKSLMATLNKEDRDLGGLGSSPNAITIYFTIKDKPRMQKRKDSLFEFSQKRERTLS